MFYVLYLIVTFVFILQLGPDGYPHLRVQRSPEPEIFMPDASIVLDPRISFDGSIRTLGSSRYSPRRSESSFEGSYIRVTEFEENSQPESTPIRPMIRVALSSETDSCHDWDDVDAKSNGTSHELCKVVRCIESEESTPKEFVESYCSSPDTKIRVSSPVAFHDERVEDRELELSLKEDETVQPSLKEDRQLESNPSNEDDYILEFPQSFKLPKSRSCNEGLRASWLNKLENYNTPPNGYESYYTGRPLGVPIKSCTFNYGVEFEKSNEEEKKISVEEEDKKIVNSIISATKEPARDDKQVEDTQVSLYFYNTLMCVVCTLFI